MRSDNCILKGASRFRYEDREKYALLFEFLLRTGGRVSEILALTPANIDLAANLIEMDNLKQKNKKKNKKTIPLHPELRQEYERYLRYIRNTSRTARIFPMTRAAVDQFLKKMNRELEPKGFPITRKEGEKARYYIHAHKFRHTFGVNAALSGVPINVLQRWLGHSSLWVTSIYTEVYGTDTHSYIARMYRPKE